ncbi:MAG: helix-turn-helix transcriptional regulator [Proteobacteria bacterium]|nr:helix-turn-helix transcriptional regulator [Pseudomonadota bacterium]
MSNSKESQKGRPLPPAMYASLADLPRLAEAYAHAGIPKITGGTDAPRVAPGSAEAGELPETCDFGLQQIDALSDDLVLVRTDFDRFSPTRINLEVSGCLYLHFRLEGLSDEEIPGAGRRQLDRESFILSATSRPGLWVRDVLGSAWRTVGIVCRPPALALQELRWVGDNLPEPLRRFGAGEEVEFAFVGELTAEMRAAVQSLMRARMPPEIRDTYLRAKVVELMCLALARVRGIPRANEAAGVAVRLSARDIEAIRSARRSLQTSSPAPSLGALARQVGINRNKLAFGFKHLFGVTVGEFERVLRLERARSLLQRQELPIRHIATLAGYEDPGSFSKAFKLEYGMLPSEWRGRHCEKMTEARFFGTSARHGEPAHIYPPD